MRFVPFIIAILVLTSCSSEVKVEETPKNVAPARTELSQDSKVFLGNRLFSEKTCITCHAMEYKKVGPSVEDIVRVYNDNNADIVAFLRGKSEPIVDKDSSQVAIMQANIDGFLKKITEEELDAISTYMEHAVKK